MRSKYTQAVRRLHTRGFTLIELLVVIGVLGILAIGAMVAINPLGQFAKARDATRKSDLKQIATALELYYDDHGEYPITTGWWSNCTGWGPSQGPNGWIPGLVPDYMKELPLDPLRKTDLGSMTHSKTGTASTHVYCYAYNSNGIDYKVTAHCGPEYAPAPAGDPFYKGNIVWGCGDWHLAVWSPDGEGI